jgi:molybdopterin synthase catalytic subunit
LLEASLFQVTEQCINEIKLELNLKEEIGGIVTFIGTVRDHNNGETVSSLEYESYIEMAEIVGKTIIKEALNKFDIVSAKAIHRIGHLKITDTAVIVSVGSHHRREAFEACEYVINTIKSKVPSWKREHYTNKSPEWVACHRCAHA